MHLEEEKSSQSEDEEIQGAGKDLYLVSAVTYGTIVIVSIPMVGSCTQQDGISNDAFHISMK